MTGILPKLYFTHVNYDVDSSEIFSTLQLTGTTENGDLGLTCHCIQIKDVDHPVTMFTIHKFNYRSGETIDLTMETYVS